MTQPSPSREQPAHTPEPDVVAPQDLEGKSPELISHVALEGTLVFETPLEKLREHAVTPTPLVFMRNSYAIPSVSDLMGDTLGIVGLVDFPLMLEVSLLPIRHTLETVVQCAGNGRAFFGNPEALEGSLWARGGVANVQFGGVWLREVLRPENIRPEARFLTARGSDGEGELFYEKSVPLSDALERGFLARQMNGEPLSRAHGGPLRLVMPGYYATTHVKWLSTLLLTEQETDNEAQQERYRMPDGSACWRMPLKSVIFSPLEGEVFSEVVRWPLHSEDSHRRRESIGAAVQLSGAAWNDGGVQLERVEVSLDQGVSWLETALERPSDRPQPEWPASSSASERYGWTRWTLELRLPEGEYELWSRAVDAAGHIQPLEGDSNWNAKGYEFHGVDRVRFRVG